MDFFYAVVYLVCFCTPTKDKLDQYQKPSDLTSLLFSLHMFVQGKLHSIKVSDMLSDKQHFQGTRNIKAISHFCDNFNM